MPLSFLFACSAGCSFPACSWGSFLACFPMALRCSTPACNIFPMALRCSAPASNFSAWRPGQQHPRYATPAISISATPPWPQHLIYGAPASNKPHLAEKSTPVWLAIWRTWAGFANSQHRDAAFATPDNICAHSSLLPH